ncbi:MAG: cold shock domain-containing protein [Phaeodactylibacter sp.]|nr:cold shock domain-containing protein [Phaeodactylibacter sp.]MCB9053020.1 cold shock domain-containing protein [Lewinellaceae bacterium]
MPVGIVQFFLAQKGYGYIRVPETREEFYFQRKNLRGTISDGDKASFVIREDKYGLYAAEVQRIAETDQAEK